MMTNAELREHSVNRTYLQPGATTMVSQFRGIDVILPVRGQKRQGRKSINDVLARPRAGEALQQFLQDEPSCQDRIPTFERIAQSSHLREQRGLITAEGERPDAGIDEQVHPRDRSTL